MHFLLHTGHRITWPTRQPFGEGAQTLICASPDLQAAVYMPGCVVRIWEAHTVHIKLFPMTVIDFSYHTHKTSIRRTIPDEVLEIELAGCSSIPYYLPMAVKLAC